MKKILSLPSSLFCKLCLKKRKKDKRRAFKATRNMREND
jgi:hypothetical protein